MIPPFDSSGNLPPGVHGATWAEFATAYGINPMRSDLLSGLYRAAMALRDAGCSILYVDGSFVTQKESPQDFDGCWEPVGVAAAKLDPVLLDFSNQRLAQKVKYGGELFPAISRAEVGSPHRTFLEFFQVDKESGAPKGIISIDLGSLP